MLTSSKAENYPQAPIPVLAKEALELRAEMLLKSALPAIGKTPKVIPVELIAEQDLGLEVDYQYLTPDSSIMGITFFEDGVLTVYEGAGRIRKKELPVRRGSVILDSSLVCGGGCHERRCRFALAHELGHWLLHQEILMHLSGSPAETLAPAELNRLEWQADYFASCLLLPRTALCAMIKEWLTQCKLSLPAMHRLSGPAMLTLYEQLLQAVCDCFEVYPEAAQLRLTELNVLK